MGIKFRRNFSPKMQWSTVWELRSNLDPNLGLLCAQIPFISPGEHSYYMNAHGNPHQDEFLVRKSPVDQQEQQWGQTSSSFTDYFDFLLFQHFLHTDLRPLLPPAPFKNQIPIEFNKDSQQNVWSILNRTSRNKSQKYPLKIPKYSLLKVI